MSLNIFSKALFLFLCLSMFISCKDDYSVCLETKISEFKQEKYSSAIWKIEHPEGPYYWFEDSLGDGIELVLNESCDLICFTDYEGVVSNGCDDKIFQLSEK